MNTLRPNHLVRFAIFGMFLATGLAGCRSHHMDIHVTNDTGAVVRLIEVDYPWASFGIDHLDPGASYQYHTEVQGDGPVTVVIPQPNGAETRINGPEVKKDQAGELDITLEPGARATFR